jgi:hypothetical protein
MEDGRKQVTVKDVVLRLSASHRKPYYNWLRQILGLASGALTLLVALQGSYIPQHPVGLPLLQLCWGLLAASILSSLLALYGESAIPLDAANNLRRMFHAKGEAQTALYIQRNDYAPPKRLYEWAEKATVLCFAASVVLMALFGAINLSHSPPQAPPALDHKAAN